VLADDHSVVRAGIRQILETAPDIRVVAEAEDGRQAIEAIGATRPDVAVLDVKMPRATGIEATRWIREHSPSTAVLVLTAFDDDPYVLALLQAGAAGYVLKSADAEQIVRAVRSVHAGPANWRCSCWWPGGGRTRPSAPSWPSARAPSRATWRRSSTSCRPKAARRRS
jgi:NarL family two-component system response regulator LiaR